MSELSEGLEVLKEIANQLKIANELKAIQLKETLLTTEIEAKAFLDSKFF
jgi:hypothetical protein